MSNQSITHEGYISQIDNNSMKVRLVVQSACIGCQAKGYCNVSDIQEKEVEVSTSNSEKYKVGDKVVVELSQNLGLKAVFLAYFLPFLLLFSTLVIIFALTNNELLSGLVALASLVPYFAIIYLFKNRIKQDFKFKIK